MVMNMYRDDNYNAIFERSKEWAAFKYSDLQAEYYESKSDFAAGARWMWELLNPLPETPDTESTVEL